jgi:hypothetical protein
MPIKYGLNDTIHEKVETIPIEPTNTAKIGVIQQSEAPIVVNAITIIFLSII